MANGSPCPLNQSDKREIVITLTNASDNPHQTALKIHIIPKL